jgi:hypothetical protein
MECCGRERDKDGGPNPHCECPAPVPVAQSAEAFACRLEEECVAGIKYEEHFCPDDAVPLIEARDKAVALRVLDEIVVAWSNQPLSSRRPVLDAIDELRAKYKEAT